MSRDKMSMDTNEASKALENETTYFTVDQVAEKIGKSTRTVHSYVDMGILSCYQEGKNHPLLFTQEHLDAYFARMERKRRG